MRVCAKISRLPRYGVQCRGRKTNRQETECICRTSPDTAVSVTRRPGSPITPALPELPDDQDIRWGRDRSRKSPISSAGSFGGSPPHSEIADAIGDPSLLHDG